MKATFLYPLAACLTALLLTVGCGGGPATNSSGTDHNHADGHDHPEPTNFTEALANVETMNSELSEAFVNGDNDEADVVLHEIFAGVKALEKFAKSDGMQEATVTEVSAASEALLTAYDYLHGVHSGKEVDYGQVSADIEAAIARLAAVDPNHPADHDHSSAGQGSDDKPASDAKPASDTQ